MGTRRARIGGQLFVVIVVGLVFCCSGFLKGGIEGFTQARRAGSQRFGAGVAKRLEDLLRTRDDARLARMGDPVALTIVRRERKRAEALCGQAAKVEFMRVTDENRARYSPAERYFACDVRLDGPLGSALAHLRFVRDEDRSKWSLTRFDVEPSPTKAASPSESSP